MLGKDMYFVVFKFSKNLMIPTMNSFLYCLMSSVWVARRPPGYAFIDFDDSRDAEDAIRELDGMRRVF